MPLSLFGGPDSSSPLRRTRVCVTRTAPRTADVVCVSVRSATRSPCSSPRAIRCSKETAPSIRMPGARSRRPSRPGLFLRGAERMRLEGLCTGPLARRGAVDSIGGRGLQRPGAHRIPEHRRQRPPHIGHAARLETGREISEEMLAVGRLIALSGCRRNRQNVGAQRPLRSCPASKCATCSQRADGAAGQPAVCVVPEREECGLELIGQGVGTAVGVPCSIEASQHSGSGAGQ